MRTRWTWRQVRLVAFLLYPSISASRSSRRFPRHPTKRANHFKDRPIISTIKPRRASSQSTSHLRHEWDIQRMPKATWRRLTRRQRKDSCHRRSRRLVRSHRTLQQWWIVTRGLPSLEASIRVRSRANRRLASISITICTKGMQLKCQSISQQRLIRMMVSMTYKATTSRNYAWGTRLKESSQVKWTSIIMIMWRTTMELLHQKKIKIWSGKELTKETLNCLRYQWRAKRRQLPQNNFSKCPLNPSDQSQTHTL